MLAKTSKEVTDRQRDCHFLTTALHNQGPRISNQLLDQVRPHLLEGDVEPTAEPMQVAMARALDANMRDTVAADEAMFYANARLDELRIERVEATRQVGQGVIMLRRMVRGQYSAPRLHHLGLGTATAKTPSLLLRQADRITAAFNGQELLALLGTPFLEGQVPPQGAAAELSARAERLRAVLDEIDELVRRRDEAYVAKVRHLDAHEQLFVYIARTFEAQCRLAGEAELAERVRRSTSRRQAEEVKEVSGKEDEEATVAPPAEVGTAAA
jgi:hypothetical protein